MKSNKLLFLLATLLFSMASIAATTSTWDTEKDGDIDKADIAKIDKNGDGKITLAEAKAAGVSEADFNKADKDKSGTITPDELAQLYTPG